MVAELWHTLDDFQPLACMHCRCLAPFLGGVKGCPHHTSDRIPENATMYGGRPTVLYMKLPVG